MPLVSVLPYYHTYPSDSTVCVINGGEKEIHVCREKKRGKKKSNRFGENTDGDEGERSHWAERTNDPRSPGADECL